MRPGMPISLELVLSYLLLITPLQAGGRPGDTQSPLTYELVVDKKVGPRTDAVACRLRIRNNTDVLQHTFRPQEKDITLVVKRVESAHYSIVFQENPFGLQNKFDIYLRPHCTIEIELAKIVLREPGRVRAPLPPSFYAVAATWKDPNLPKIRDSVFEIVEQDVPLVPQVQTSGNEYPFDVVLKPTSTVYYRDEPIVVAIRLENHGNDAMVLVNHFSPYRDFFLFEKKYATSGEKMQDPRVFRGTITPVTGEGYITLLPGEQLSVDMDISDEFPIPAEYSVSTTYLHTLLLCPLEGKPHYTKQYKWPSSEVAIAISDAPRPNDQATAPQQRQTGEKHSLALWLLTLGGGVSIGVVAAFSFVVLRRTHVARDK